MGGAPMTDHSFETMVQQHTDWYAEVYGRHPYTDCWPWAEAALTWSRAHEQQLGGSLRYARLRDGDPEHVTAAIAETLRLNMARHLRTAGRRTLGDLSLDYAAAELGFWARGTGDLPRQPGTRGWPEPTGPYAGRWRAAFMSGDRERPERLARGAAQVLRGLAYRAARFEYRMAAVDYRMTTYNEVYVAVADTAPFLGIATPVEVEDPLAYQGIEGLTAVPARALADAVEVD